MATAVSVTVGTSVPVMALPPSPLVTVLVTVSVAVNVPRSSTPESCVVSVSASVPDDV